MKRNALTKGQLIIFADILRRMHANGEFTNLNFSQVAEKVTTEIQKAGHDYRVTAANVSGLCAELGLTWPRDGKDALVIETLRAKIESLETRVQWLESSIEQPAAESLSAGGTA